jgi:DNA-3-methyladenine glycosylase
VTYARVHAGLRPLDGDRLTRTAPHVAGQLLGTLLAREEPDGSTTLARIVETEAYRQTDPASHSHVGVTTRTAPMFGAAGTAYVYRSYGLHWCCNVVAEPAGVGAAVLLRAAVVLAGGAAVTARRGASVAPAGLLRGPGNLTRGLDIDALRHDGGDLVAGCGGLRLLADAWRPAADQIRSGPRVGVRLAADIAWRFWLPVPEVSVYRRSPRASRPTA